MSIKDRVLLIVQRNVGAAHDNLNRARRMFNGMSAVQLNNEYGESGSTCAELLDKYQQALTEAEECVSWVERS